VRARPSPAVVAFAAVVACALPIRSAKAQDKAQCIAAAEQGQKLRDQGKLRSAREKFVACGQSSCPPIVGNDCARWLAEVDEVLPSIVIAAHDDRGADLTAVQVFIDGNLVTDKLDGKPIAIDPGTRTLRFEHAGSAAVEKQLVVREGERHRAVDVAFAAPPAPAEPARPAPMQEGSTLAPPVTERPPPPPRAPVAGYVLAGTAVAALGGFTYFGLKARADVSSLQGHCAPGCPDADVSNARREALVADILLGVGVLAGAGAAWVFIAHARATHASVVAYPSVGPASVSASVLARF